jgi:hypothetical protein
MAAALVQGAAVPLGRRWSLGLRHRDRPFRQLFTMTNAVFGMVTTIGAVVSRFIHLGVLSHEPF